MNVLMRKSGLYRTASPDSVTTCGNFTYNILAMVVFGFWVVVLVFFAFSLCCYEKRNCQLGVDYLRIKLL